MIYFKNNKYTGIYFQIINKPNGPESGWDIPSMRQIDETIEAYKASHHNASLPNKIEHVNPSSVNDDQENGSDYSSFKRKF